MARMSWLGEQLVLDGRVIGPQQAIDGLARVDADAIRAAAAAVIRVDRAAMALVHPRAAQGAAGSASGFWSLLS